MLPLAMFTPGETESDNSIKAFTTEIDSYKRYSGLLADTLHITSEGDSLAATLDGEIIQVGENNSIEINSGRGKMKSSEISNKRTSAGDDSLRLNSRKQTSGNKSRIKINQNGNNNSVLINTP